MITREQTQFICDYAMKEASLTCPDRISTCYKCHSNQVAFLNKKFPHVHWRIEDETYNPVYSEGEYIRIIFTYLLTGPRSSIG